MRLAPRCRFISSASRNDAETLGDMGDVSDPELVRAVELHVFGQVRKDRILVVLSVVAT